MQTTLLTLAALVLTTNALAEEMPRTAREASTGQSNGLKTAGGPGTGGVRAPVDVNQGHNPGKALGKAKNTNGSRKNGAKITESPTQPKSNREK